MNVPRPLLKQAVASLLFISAVFAVAIPVLYLVHRPLKPPIAAGAWFASCVTTFLISSERRDLAQFFINSLGWLPFAVACITFPLWYWTASHLNSIQGAFFEVGAQVIPVILLATTLEVRLSRTLETSDLAVTIAILLGGEILALYGAAIGDVSHVGFTAAWRYAVVSAALSSGFFTLIMGVIADYDPKPVRRPPPQRRPDPKLLPLAARRSRRNR